jgi:hypothetical protein
MSIKAATTSAVAMGTFLHGKTVTGTGVAFLTKFGMICIV